MKNYLLLALTMAFLTLACNPKIEEELVDAELQRMPFNERVFLLNNVAGESRIYELDYDFQGLGDEAILNRFTTQSPIPSGGHMTISPDKQWITIVISRKSKIYLVNINDGSVRELELFNFNPNGINDYQAHFDSQKFKGSITQVDVDQEGYLFLAGKAGFFKVVADNGNGTDDPSLVNGGPDIWNDEDKSLDKKLPAQAGKIWVHAVKFEFSNDNYVETTDDGEDYFEDVSAFNSKRVKFRGGDILFTQNTVETDGFERQRLLSFSQWKGNTAIALDLNWDWNNQTISFNAGQVFGGNRNSAFHRKNKALDSDGTERVTGAALTGDNYVFTSHHKRNYLNLWNLTGDHISKVTFTINDPAANNKFKDGKVIHNWGDMTSTQAFDKNTYNDEDDALSNREIDGHYYNDWYKGNEDNHQYAEVKLYRPGSGMQKDPNNLSDDEYNSSNDSRPNAANADIADYRKNAEKFVSLGKEGGYILMRFPESVDINQETMLQVVETSWNKPSSFANINDAFNSYPEKANVFILKGASPRYYIQGLEKHVSNPSGGEWVHVGKASIAGNELPLADIPASSAGAGDRDRLVGESFQWVMIRDKFSTSPDGFDLNFVSAYDEAITCGDNISEANFTTSYDSEANEIVINWDFTAAELGLRENGGIQIWAKNGRQYEGNRDQIGTGLWTAEEIDAQELRISAADFNFSGDDCLQDISFSFHTVCDRTADGWVRGNVFSFENKLETAGEYCNVAPLTVDERVAQLSCEGADGDVAEVPADLFWRDLSQNGEINSAVLNSTDVVYAVNGNNFEVTYSFTSNKGSWTVNVPANSWVLINVPAGATMSYVATETANNNVLKTKNSFGTAGQPNCD